MKKYKQVYNKKTKMWTKLDVSGKRPKIVGSRKKKYSL